MIQGQQQALVQEPTRWSPRISAVDLFCGAGGLTYGLRQAGIAVVAGIDIDTQSQHAFEVNNAPAKFLTWDLGKTRSSQVGELFEPKTIRLLAGCAPCQPFSKYTNGKDKHQKWKLLLNFARYIRDLRPEVVTMENVPELETRGKEIFEEFTSSLYKQGYSIDWAVVDCADYGVPQHRKRLVLLASTLGELLIPAPTVDGVHHKTVRETIEELAPLASGGQDAHDRLHVAALLSDTNLERVRATPHDGGTRASWPEHLLPDCYKRKSGARYTSVYGRLRWDKPANTMTTLCTGLGNGRFGHPVQDRAISLREAALFQSFPPEYEFWPQDKKLHRGAIARMIGNAVPPQLGNVLGQAILDHVERITNSKIHEGNA